MICIDNPDFKLKLYNHGITHVPTLLVEYYNGSKQKFERDYIYMWINQIITRNLKSSQLNITNNDSLTEPNVSLVHSIPTPNEQNQLNRRPFGNNSASSISSTSINYSNNHDDSTEKNLLTILQTTPEMRTLKSDIGVSSSTPVQIVGNSVIPSEAQRLATTKVLKPSSYTQESQDHKTPSDATIPMNMNKKLDIAAIALEMQKNRDIELAEIKEYQKPI
jgi:hypothetical protein